MSAADESWARASGQGNSASLRDRIAQHAAALLNSGRERDLAAAVRVAAASLHARGNQDLPSPALVRKHAQGMAQAALGDRAYVAGVRSHLQVAADAMHTLEAELDLDAATALVGRAARGHTDADPVLHVRAYTRAPIARIAQALVDSGLPEPEIRTVETLRGRANQLRFALPACTLVVLRCLPEWARGTPTDLVTGRATTVQSLEQLQQFLQG